MNFPWLLRQWKKCRGSEFRSIRLLHRRHRMPPSASPTSKDAGDLNRRDILYSAQEKGKSSWLRNRPVRQANSLIVGPQRSQEASERRPREWEDIYLHHCGYLWDEFQTIITIHGTIWIDALWSVAVQVNDARYHAHQCIGQRLQILFHGGGYYYRPARYWQTSYSIISKTPTEPRLVLALLWLFSGPTILYFRLVTAFTGARERYKKNLHLSTSE